MSAIELSEPEVLAPAKNILFSKLATEVGYAVTDTQFSTTHWHDRAPIRDEIRSQLSPFNHVRVAGGYPDLVAAAWLKEEYYRGTVNEIEAPPLVIIEAKGLKSDGKIDATESIIQAHERLSEANLAFSALPSQAITDHVQSLGRELNVGIISVAQDGGVEMREKPRLVGAQIGKEASVIRFQAGPQSVAGQSFHLNRPKNYLAYPICMYSSRATDKDTPEEILSEYVVRDVESARNGAVFLGLIEKDHTNNDGLTPLGEEVVRFGLQRHQGSVDSLLEEFREWKRKQTRLTRLAPEWALLARWIVYSYPATQLLVKTIQKLQRRVESPRLPELVQEMYEENPTFAIEFFIRDTDDARSKVLTTEGKLNNSSLSHVDVYRSVTTYQFKQMLYHCGILSESGNDTSNLNPEESIWELEHSLRY